MQVVILDNAEEVAKYGADIFIQQIKNKPNSVLGLASGSTPLALYKKLVTAYKNKEISFSQIQSFNLDEYLGIAAEHPQSYRHFMNTNLFDLIDIDKSNTALPPSETDDPHSVCEAYEIAIKISGGIDLQLLGLGRNGHIGFNEPSSSLASRTRVKTLTKETVSDNARFFTEDEFQPNLAITMGIGTISEAKKIVLLATGENKADAVTRMVQGQITANCPASILQVHMNTIVVIDEAAASKLENKDFFKHVEALEQGLQKKRNK